MQQNPPPPPPRKAPLGKPRTLTRPAGALTPPADQRIPVAGPPEPPAGQSVPVAGPPQARATRHYGHTPRRSIEVRTQRYLLFGIPYAIVFVPLHLLLFGGAILSIMTVDSVSDPQLADFMLKTFVALLVITGLGLAYSSLATLMCIRGSTAGLVMGIVHTGLVLLIFMLNLVRVTLVGPMGYEQTLIVSIGTPILALLFILGLVQFVRRERGSGDPHQVFEGPLMRVQPGAVYAPAAGHAPVPATKDAPAAEPAIKPKPALTGAQRAFIELLGMAASIDDSRAETRLKRARQAAHKVLGPDHRAAVMNLLNEPALIGNLHDDLDAVAKQIREDERLRAVALKAAAAVLKDENVLDDQATELLQHLKLSLA